MENLILKVFGVSRAWNRRVFIDESLKFLVLFIEEIFFSPELL
jgi:hypothetical protein